VLINQQVFVVVPAKHYFLNQPHEYLANKSSIAAVIHIVYQDKPTWLLHVILFLSFGSLDVYMSCFGGYAKQKQGY
jgi:nitrate/nitrite transporter NarK